MLLKYKTCWGKKKKKKVLKVFCFIYINVLKGTGDFPENYQQMATPPAASSGGARGNCSAALRMR